MIVFNFVQTEDGSPTLRIAVPSASGSASGSALGDLQSEAMHSLKGAFSETVYIYGTAIQTCLERGFRPHVLSMGLGMGYVEILTAALFLKAGVKDAGGESFEIVPELREWFMNWALAKGEVPSDFLAAYGQILARTSKETGVSEIQIQSYLRDMLTSKAWKTRSEMEPLTKFDMPFGCICFDAFSSKSTPVLWTEEFLKSFLGRAADERCVLSTYACTGALKRSLKEAGFDVQIRLGFASKRDSTFAVRL